MDKPITFADEINPSTAAGGSPRTHCAGSSGASTPPNSTARSDYLTALRQLSRSSRPGVLLDVLRFAHDYTSRIDFSSVEMATQTLTRTNAFEDADEGQRIKMPEISLSLSLRT